MTLHLLRRYPGGIECSLVFYRLSLAESSQGESKLAHAHGAKRRGLGCEWRAGLAGGQVT